MGNLVREQQSCCEPLLKWPGGKRRLINFILPLVPEAFNRYFEPFLGGGALFFALKPRTAYLSDGNAELIHAYSEVRNRPNEVMRALKRLPNNEVDYYRIRSSTPRSDVQRQQDSFSSLRWRSTEFTG
jgi:DNA adenine methylase